MRAEGGKAWFWRWWWLSLIGALSLISGAAHAALDAPTQRGLDWLSTQIQANGQLSGERTSAALPMQVRSEAALTLRALSQTVPPALFSAIDGVQPDTTEYLARKALAKQLAGASDAAALNALEPMQNADGGFGAATGLASNPQDTAWALRALHANRKSGVSATKALAWVQSNQQSEGSWKLVPGPLEPVRLIQLPQRAARPKPCIQSRQPWRRSAVRKRHLLPGRGRRHLRARHHRHLAAPALNGSSGSIRRLGADLGQPRHRCHPKRHLATAHRGRQHRRADR